MSGLPKLPPDVSFDFEDEIESVPGCMLKGRFTGHYDEEGRLHITRMPRVDSFTIVDSQRFWAFQRRMGGGIEIPKGEIDAFLTKLPRYHLLAGTGAGERSDGDVATENRGRLGGNGAAGGEGGATDGQ